MKNTLTTLSLLFFLSCGNNTTMDTHNVTIINLDEQVVKQEILLDSINGAYLKLDKNRYDFGKISRKKTPDISIEFDVQNLGKVPLVILKADVSCGCLSVDFPPKPIQPREKVKLTVNIDTRSQEGAFNKTIFIKSNADNDVELIRIFGEVKNNF